MRFLVPALTLLLALTASAAQYIKPYGKLKEEQKFKDYMVRIYRNEQPPPDTDKNPAHQDGLGCFEILKAGKQVYFKTGVIFEVENDAVETNNSFGVKMGQGIMGDKQPDLVIYEVNGGSNPGCDYYIFQIGDTFRFIDALKNTGGGDFRDLRGDGNLELMTCDVVTFQGWNCCEVDSPHPTVIYRYLNGKYRPDLEMMKKPAPPEKELQRMAKELKAKFIGIKNELPYDKWCAPTEMWQKMLDLIYSGNMASAWKLCELSWPAKHPGKMIFLKEFTAQLMTSPYYNDINQASFQGVTVKKG